MELVCDLEQWIGGLLFDDRTADMVFIVERERLLAHRAILSASCEYFRALLYGNMRESLQHEVVLEDVPLRGFKLVMRYIYTGRLRVDDVNEETLFEVLSIAHMYGITELETSLSEHMQKSLSVRNACTIYNKAHSLRFEDLGEACYHFMIQEPDEILESEAFFDLSEAALCEVLSWDTFYADEIKIFEAVLRWRAKRQFEQDLGNVLKEIRLPLIDAEDLLTTVKDSGLISMELVTEAIETRECHAADRNFRGSLEQDVNLATLDHGARWRATIILKSDVPEIPSILQFIDGDMPSFTAHSHLMGSIGLTVTLFKPFFINHIGFKICGRSFACSYYVEVSNDQENWVRVIDYSKYSCGSLQDLYFDRRVVRYIRLIGTSANKPRHYMTITEIRVDHTTKPFKLSHGFYAPEENVSCSARGASCIVSRSLGDSKALITDGNTEDAKDSKWSSHEIGDGYMLIKLPQPYTVDSMRMLLRSDNSRAYMYYVETSLDRKKWTRVTDRTSDFCSSWQDITFEARPVLFIKIVGTASKRDKIFSCSRFECPAPPRDLN